ncbi:response regulator transcription factor [Streptomyces sp. NBC_01775]|uniref:response regulator transcription factor n=1 Tax=Streptomyces sp. NBC_01775 TaxID=2975939 RepID=UPI002DD862F8|nr:response regulator transcription factor [Streptomyces sp. NBC_01775]WSB77785.1 response regulator transcription factor [Streptomyces sp. NBC_01775]
MSDPVRVLICEDQQLVRAGYVAILDAQPDVEVVGEAGDGRAAVDTARQLRPDVVVMDVHLPGMDGIEATRLLAGPDAADPVKVLVVAERDLDEHVYEVLRAGADGFLLKDAPSADLINAVHTIATGDSLLAPAVTRGLIGRFGDRIRPVPAAPPAGCGRVGLTRRETQVLRLLATGLSNTEIAAQMVISPETVKTHVSRILAKLELRDRVQAVVFAYRTGVVEV